MKSLFSLTRFIQFWRAVAFVALSAFIMTVGSEKMYWYIQGLGAAGDASLLVLVYMMPVLVALWFVARGGTTLAGLIIAGATFGWVVEGVITAELYGDGPIGPFFPSYFAGWHGLLSLVTLWYLFRKWAVAGNRWLLGGTAAALGVFWGWWSMSYWLPDAIDDPDLIEAGFDVGVWTADKFTIYAFIVGGALATAHWLIGYVWPDRWCPSKRWTVISLGLITLMAGPVLLGVPWGTLKLGALLGIAWWANHRRPSDEPTVFSALRGRASVADVAPILVMPLTASLVYTVGLAVRPGDAALSILSFWIPTTLVAFVGGAAVLWAVRQRRRETTAATDSQLPKTPKPGTSQQEPQTSS
ncbi:hypothetical protein MNBD_ACTINO02-7 [hydrothermal vent metagenome]|uniref:Uncharacterized protein n=1 Tax=hydrothermal vent metagenome TaxID=652676 RepID=A0A3B0RVQ0_9ZZZZ